MKTIRTRPLNYLGTAIFVVTMIVAASGVYWRDHNIDSLIILLAIGVAIAAFALVLIRSIFYAIEEVNNRQRLWEEDRRANDIIAAGRHQQALDEISDQLAERRRGSDRDDVAVEATHDQASEHSLAKAERKRVQDRDERIDNG